MNIIVVVKKQINKLFIFLLKKYIRIILNYYIIFNYNIILNGR